MNSAERKGEKIGHRLILLLVVALVAFSTAMKELNQLQEFGLDASRLIAQLSDQLVPSEVHQAAVTVETCDSENAPEQSRQSVELPWINRVAEEVCPNGIAPVRRQIEVKKSPGPRMTAAQIAKLKQLPSVAADPFELEVRVFLESLDTADELVPSDVTMTFFKSKFRKQAAPKISPRDREVLLRTLNRSITLRSAS
jgi:hypothetical protein